MTTDLDLPTLDRLHAEASRTPWVATGIELSSVTDSTTPSRDQLEKNAAFIAALVNTFPSLSARVKELEASNAELKRKLELRQRFELLVEAAGDPGTSFLAGNPYAPRIKELESALAQLHEAVGRGPGHGTVKETLACALSGIGDLRQSEHETAEENKALEKRVTDLETEIATLRADNDILDADQSAALTTLLSAPPRVIPALHDLLRRTYVPIEVDARERRIGLLEETLRGIIQEKQKQRDLMQSGAIDKAGTKAGEAYEWAKGEIEREIAWLERVLRGDK